MSKQRTGGMTIIGGLDVLFGSCGIILALGGILGALAGERQAIVVEGSMGIAGATAGQQALMLNLLGMSLLGLLLGLVALVAGIALFRMWRWARAINLTYAALAAARSAMLFLFPALTAARGATAAATLSERMVGLCLALLYPIILLALFRKPAWKAAFAPSSVA